MSAASRRRPRAARHARSTPAAPTAWLWSAGGILLGLRVALIPLVFDRDALYAFAVPKALLGRVLSLLILSVLVALYLREGKGAFRWSPIHLPVAAYAMAMVLAAVFAVDPVLAVFGAEDRMLGLLGALDVVVLYAAVVTFVRTRHDAGRMAAAIAVPALLAAGYAYLQAMRADPLRWVGDVTGRTFSTLGNPTALDQYLATLAFAGAAAAVLVPLPPRGRALVLAGAAFLLGAAITTGGKALVLGAVAAGVTLTGALLLRLPSVRARLLASAAVGAALAGLFLVVLATPLGARLAVDRSPDATLFGLVDRGRVVLYQVAGQVLLSRPILGAGPDNYAAVFPLHRPEASTRLLSTSVAESSPHSWLAKAAVDAGILGVAALLGVIAFAAREALIRRDPLQLTAAVGAATFLAMGIVSITDVGTEWLLWVLVGLIAAPGAAVLASGRPEPRRPNVLAMAAIAIAIAAAVPALVEWQASRDAQASKIARTAGDPGRALGHATSAVRLDDRRGTYWNELGLVHAAAGRMADAARAFREASSRAPYRSEFSGNIARAEIALALRGDASARERAVAAARLGVARDPYGGDARYTLALAAGTTGDHRTAAAESEMGWRLKPNVTDEAIYVNAVRAYMALRDHDSSERWARWGIQWTKPGLDLRSLLAEILKPTAHRAEARALVEEVLRARPNDPTALRLRDELATD